MFWIDNHYFVTKDRESWVLTYEREGKINPATGKPKITKKQKFSGSFKGCLVLYAKDVQKPLPDIDRIIARMDKTDALLTTIEAKAVEEITSQLHEEKAKMKQVRTICKAIAKNSAKGIMYAEEDIFKLFKYVGIE